MKTIRIHLFQKNTITIHLGLLLAFTLGSCSVQKRVYSNGYTVHWKNSSSVNHTKEVTEEIQFKNSDFTSEVSQSKTPAPIVKNTTPKDSLKDCDTLILNNGNIMLVTIEQIGSDFIKYKKCDGTEDISYLTKKENVKDVKRCEKKIINPAKKSNLPTTHPFSILGFVLGLLSFLIPFGGYIIVPLLVLSPLFALLSIIFGAISLHKIKQNPEKFKGKILSILGIIGGIIMLILIILLIIFIFTW